MAAGRMPSSRTALEKGYRAPPNDVQRQADACRASVRARPVLGVFHDGAECVRVNNRLLSERAGEEIMKTRFGAFGVAKRDHELSDDDSRRRNPHLVRLRRGTRLL